MTEEQLLLCYQVARDTQNKRAADLAMAKGWTDASPKPDNVCRYCGKGWRVWRNSSLDGHARCSVTPEFQRQVSDWVDADPKRTYQGVATLLGVSYSIAKAWIHVALKSQGLPGLR